MARSTQANLTARDAQLGFTLHRAAANEKENLDLHHRQQRTHTQLLDVDPQQEVSQHLFEDDAQKIFDVEPRISFLDLGGNLGLWSLVAAVVHKAEVFAFEPVVGNFNKLFQTLFCSNKELLGKNFAHNFLHLVRATAGAPETEGEKRTLSMLNWSTVVLDQQNIEAADIVQRNQPVLADSGRENLAIDAAEQLGLVREEDHTIRLHTVDRIWNRHWRYNRNGGKKNGGTLSQQEVTRDLFIKADVEGYECAALLGAEEFLRHSRVWGLMFEYSAFWAEKTAVGTSSKAEATSCTNPRIRARLSKLFMRIGLTHFYGFGASWMYPQFACHIGNLWRFVDRTRIFIHNTSALNIVGLPAHMEHESFTALWNETELTQVGGADLVHAALSKAAAK
ncbi:unnamed protein product [Amoebophrya sp. A120]|nr:unnamed protein product [Amoebophrya sp. A120]|eukprot:GSA120T00020055001.1